jgi:hypothetical protein
MQLELISAIHAILKGIGPGSVGLDTSSHFSEGADNIEVLKGMLKNKSW